MFYQETERLILKPHTLDNLEKFNRWENDPELRLLSDDQPPDQAAATLEETRSYFQKMMTFQPEPSIIYYAIHTKETGSFIGFGMIAHIDRYNRSCKLGILIGERSTWGQGFAREALQAVIAYCFRQLKMNRIGAEIYAINPRSIRLFEGLGFQHEGTIREHVLKNGAFVDELVYGLLCREWMRQNQA